MYAYVQNDNIVWLRGAQTTQLTTGAQVFLESAATVTFRVQTQTYEDVPGQLWPAQMTYVSGSQGDFIGVLRNEVLLEPATEYRFIATVDAGPDQHGTWDIPLHARQR